MRVRYAMAVDTVRCMGCGACVVACKTENGLPEGVDRTWIAQELRGRFPTLSMEVRSERCNQCDAAPCVGACPTGASFVAEGGIVAVDASKCTGCKACVAACAYGARAVHPDGHVDKCTFCLHRVRAGRLPACVENCPARALTFGDVNDPRSDISRLLASRKHRVLRPELGARPHVFFLE
ncbi:MAG TPA: 4Fe-4S dicluster domain-containing protein [Aggregicoccus sp.]|nr:4Fe-4S dicluster domain-containing protein [Aggregicoccus sp.]